MRALAFPFLLASSIAASAASPEDAYLAARDRDIAALRTFEDASDSAKGDALMEKARRDLEKRMRTIIGRVAVTGFPAEGKLNLETLFAHDEGFAMLDGLVYGGSESDKSLVVSTPTLLAKWLAARRSDAKETELPRAAAAAAKTELFYTWAVSTGSAAIHYAALPVVVPPGATFAVAMLSARTQDMSPPAPDEIFVTLETGDRVFVVEEKLRTPMSPIAACDAVTADYTKEAEAADKAYVVGHRDDAKLADRGSELRNQGDAAFRACYGTRAKDSPAFKAATDQADAILSALAKARH